ncbi:hypothetical protein C8R45DRAFT_1086429 [Mycena sanguinolenta]|nr:hypothetical protein C8R45DRAFT_1086429 [Mycena sanguinolenta]
MTTFPTTAASTAVADRAEIMAVLATRTSSFLALPSFLLICHRSERVPVIVRLLDLPAAEEETPARTWTAGTPRTPAQVAAEHANVAEGSRSLWVVFVRREPGVYTTIESADLQIKGVPNQQYRRKSSKSEALQFYREKYDAGQVQK